MNLICYGCGCIYAGLSVVVPNVPEMHFAVSMAWAVLNTMPALLNSNQFLALVTDGTQPQPQPGTQS